MKMQIEQAKISKKQTAVFSAIVGVALMMASGAASAQQADALGDGICKLVELLTGKWLFGFTILATLGAGAALLFGGEITDGLKKIATIISIVGIILATASILSMVFGSLMKAC